MELLVVGKRITADLNLGLIKKSDEKTIEATMSECGNDRETAFDRLMSKIYTNQVP